MLALVGSANIACGGHTGDAHSMRAALIRAKEHGVTIGAHPSFPDRKLRPGVNADRARGPVREPTSNGKCAHYKTLQKSSGLRLHHIKPHGALYNRRLRSWVGRSDY